MRKNPRGLHREQWDHAAGCRRWFNVERDTVTLRDPGASTAWTSQHPRENRHDAEPPLGRRRPHRPRPAARASPSTAGPTRAIRRHAGLGTARQRRPPRRPQLQVPPAARHRDGRGRGAQRAGPARHRGSHRAQRARHRGRAVRGAGRRERQLLARPRARRVRGHPARRPLPAGRLLLQDLHVAALVLDALRALDPQGLGPGRGAARARPRQLRQAQRPLRRAGRGRRPGRARGSARRRPRRARG